MRLPNAPLVEVVFEIRWEGEKTGPALPVNFGFDPGFPVFERLFDAEMAKIGFTKQELMMQPGLVFLWVPKKRYRKADGSPFPIIQIGHGTVAFNFSTDYEWSLFKAFVLNGLDLLSKTYPTGSYVSLRPMRVELRYIDSFDKDLLGHNSLASFLRDDTNIDYRGFGFVETNTFDGEDSGAFRVEKKLAKQGVGQFSFEVSKANNGAPVMLNSSVIKEQDFEMSKWTDKLVPVAEEWLEDAHAVTSSFFKSLVSQQLMDHFKRKAPTKNDVR